MDTLREMITSLQRFIEKPTSRCAIVSEDGCIDESSLMGTQDGHLCLALAILQFVDACDNKNTGSSEIERLNEEKAYWGDNIKTGLHQLPGHYTSIVGSYLFDDHQSFLAALEREVNPTLGNEAMLRNDPDFHEP